MAKRGSKTEIFSQKTFQRTKVISANQNITNAPESLPNLRKEIARVFHQANRRIQNLEKADVLSPALKALNISENTGFSKFAMSNKTWLELKHDYLKAIEFLKQPTSTAGGSREYEKHLKKSLDLSEKDFELLKRKMMADPMWDAKERHYTDNVLWRYSDFKEVFTEETKSLADKIEEESENGQAPELLTAYDKDAKEMIEGANTFQEKVNVVNNLRGFEEDFF